MRQTDEAGAAAGSYDGSGIWGGRRMLDLRRREFILALGSAATWPLAAGASRTACGG